MLHLGKIDPFQLKVEKLEQLLDSAGFTLKNYNIIEDRGNSVLNRRVRVSFIIESNPMPINEVSSFLDGVAQVVKKFK